MYIAGRLRTGSKPSSTSMFSAVYVVMLLGFRQARYLRLRQDHFGYRTALEQGVAFATARNRLVLFATHFELGARFLFHDERIRRLVQELSPDQRIRLAQLDQLHALAGTGEHADLFGVA